MIHAKNVFVQRRHWWENISFPSFCINFSSCIHIFLWMVLFIRKGNLLKIITKFFIFSFSCQKKDCKEELRKLIFFSSYFLFFFVTARSLSLKFMQYLWWFLWGLKNVLLNYGENQHKEELEFIEFILLMVLKFKFMRCYLEVRVGVWRDIERNFENYMWLPPSPNHASYIKFK